MATVDTAPMDSRPYPGTAKFSSAPRNSSMVWMMRLEYEYTSSPAGVNDTWRPARTKSWVCSFSSSVLTCLLTAGWLMLSTSAARVKPPSSTTVQNVTSCAAARALHLHGPLARIRFSAWVRVSLPPVPNFDSEAESKDKANLLALYVIAR